MSTPIQITGNLTTAPELQYLPTGRPVARFTVAVNSRRRSEAGEWVDGETTFFPVTVWAEQAEHVAQSLAKGSRVVVLGTIKARSWTPTDGERAGQTLTRLEVTAEVVAASLQWATATMNKAARSENQGWADAPVAGEEDQPAPF
jgi:single-strand DNA-binding protein